ncbi:hypothetical protein [Ideonella sp.]|uniref:hypothetical protein n=1 Tax=Ideonella sp. TaxID=1929293 RepID=UPI003BB4A617
MTPTLAAVSDTVAPASMTTSFGGFKPVSHVMVGLPAPAQLDALALALNGAGWRSEAVLRFVPKESVAALQILVDNTGAMAGFGYEITLLRRYLALSEQGTQWLLVKVDDLENAQALADLARAQGASLAVYYRMLTVEELF